MNIPDDETLKATRLTRMEKIATSVGKASGAAAIRSAAKASPKLAEAAVGTQLLPGVMTPYEPSDSSRLRRADEIFALILKIVTVLALSFGLFEYDRQKSDRRVSESLQLVEQWENDGFRDAYAKVNDMVWPIFDASRKAAPALFDDEKARATALANIGETVTGADDNFTTDADKTVDKVFHFFERAALCADQQICDYGVLKTFLGSEAQSFWLYFSRYADRRRLDGYPTYGKWTERLVNGQITPARFLGLI